MDECSLGHGLCSNGTCVNTDGSYECDCHKGFILNSGGFCRGKWRHFLKSNGFCGVKRYSFTLSLSTVLYSDINTRDVERTREQVFNFKLYNARSDWFPAMCASGYVNPASTIFVVYFIRLYNTFFSSSDVNECSQEDICRNGLCTNTEGSFLCECTAGYTLNEGNTSCRGNVVKRNEMIIKCPGLF